MYTYKIIRHDLITAEDLETVIMLKTVAWPYNSVQQREWINANLNNIDFHTILYLNKEPVAYLNLINAEIRLDDISLPALGIGNVCALKKGKGWGKELMLRANLYIINNNKVGLLFCKDNLISFYAASGWSLAGHNNLFIPSITDKVNTMTLNIKFAYNKLEYLGRAF